MSPRTAVNPIITDPWTQDVIPANFSDDAISKCALTDAITPPKLTASGSLTGYTKKWSLGQYAYNILGLGTDNLSAANIILNSVLNYPDYIKSFETAVTKYVKSISTSTLGNFSDDGTTVTPWNFTTYLTASGIPWAYQQGVATYNVTPSEGWTTSFSMVLRKNYETDKNSYWKISYPNNNTSKWSSLTAARSNYYRIVPSSSLKVNKKISRTGTLNSYFGLDMSINVPYLQVTKKDVGSTPIDTYGNDTASTDVYAFFPMYVKYDTRISSLVSFLDQVYALWKPLYDAQYKKNTNNYIISPSAANSGYKAVAPKDGKGSTNKGSTKQTTVDMTTNNRKWMWNPPAHRLTKTRRLETAYGDLYYVDSSTGSPVWKSNGVWDVTNMKANSDDKYPFTGNKSKDELRLGRIYQADNIYLGESNSDSGGFYGTKNRYGFRFHYNPTTIGYSANVDETMQNSLAAQTDPSMPLTFGGLNLSLTIYLNRIFDMSSAKVDMYAPNIKLGELAAIKERGTEYDLEYLFRVINGDPLPSSFRTYRDGNSGFVQDLSDSKNHSFGSADYGMLNWSLVNLRLSNALWYLGRIQSFEVQHLIFTKNMVPVFSSVNISFQRQITFDTVNLTDAPDVKATTP